MTELSVYELVAIWLLPILFAVTLHEASHGYVAYRLGDDTAYLKGRITLNPFKHIDLFGTLIIPIALLVTTGFVFGWAKPVPVDPGRLRHPKRDMALVALAGPLSNLFMAILWMVVFKIGVMLVQNKTPVGFPISFMGQAGVLINLVLMVLNLFPIPPLDGSRVVTFFLPPPWDKRYNQLHPLLGFLLIVALIATGVLSSLLTPVIGAILKILLIVFQIQLPS